MSVRERYNLHHPISWAMQIKQEHPFWKVVVALGITLFFVNSVLFILLGQANADEGWYLYASKLVYSGQLPYQDFAFTQTPLLPYIYGIPQHFLFQSLYLGRVTSAVFSIIAFSLSLLTARDYGGKTAMGITSLLGGTFTFGIYFQSITKTYALTTFFFILAFFVLSSNYRRDLKLILSTLFVLLATLTRLSAIFFAVPFIVYAFFASEARSKWTIIALCLGAAFWVLMLALPNIDAAVWGLVTHHASQWGDITVGKWVSQILSFRTMLLFMAFLPYIILWGTIILAVGFKQIRSGIVRHSAIFVTATGLLLFAIPNLVSGGFHTEYYVPFLFISFPIIGIVYTRIFDRQGKISKAFMSMALLYAVIAGELGVSRGHGKAVDEQVGGGYYFIDISGGYAPVEEIRNVSSVISENSTAEDRVFVLEALWLAIESDRQVMPNMTMAQFSYYDTNTKTANHLHLINDQIILSYIESADPKLIILTDLDWGTLQNSPEYEKIATSLEKNYYLIYRENGFGQISNNVEVYNRRKAK